MSISLLSAVFQADQREQDLRGSAFRGYNVRLLSSTTVGVAFSTVTAPALLPEITRQTYASSAASSACSAGPAARHPVGPPVGSCVSVTTAPASRAIRLPAATSQRCTPSSK